MTDQYAKQLEQYYERVVDVYDSSYTGIGRYRSNYFRLRILVDLLHKAMPRPLTILDAGCGDARPLAELLKYGFDIRGYDVSDAMLNAGRNILREAGHDENRIWKGSIYDAQGDAGIYDAVACMGVVENLPDHPKIFSEFRRVLKPGGRLFISLENDLFSLFSINKYSIRFLDGLFSDIGVPADIRSRVISDIAKWNQLDAISMLKKTFEDAEIDKSGVRIASYNPLNVHGELRKLGFEVEEIRFFHYHPLPPRFEVEYPDLFQGAAEKLETTEYDWRGGILCNCMVVQARAVVSAD